MALNEAGLTSESCTSREPAWKVPSYSRKYDSVPLSSLQFTKPSFESLMNIPTKSRKRVKVDISDIPPISSQEMQSLLNVAPRSAAAIYIEKENVIGIRSTNWVNFPDLPWNSKICFRQFQKLLRLLIQRRNKRDVLIGTSIVTEG